MPRFRDPQVTYEQGEALARRLQNIGMTHGDTVRATIFSVGIYRLDSGTPHLTFCPTKLGSPRILRRGSRTDRRKPMPTNITFDSQLSSRIRKEAPPNGFGHFFSVLIRSNGSLRISLQRKGSGKEGLRFEPSSTLTGDWVQYPEAYGYFRAYKAIQDHLWR